MSKPNTITSLSQDAKTIMGLYGHPSSGKTDFICQGAKDGMKILLLRCDLDHIPARALASGAEQWVVRDWAEMNNEVLEYIRHDSSEWDWIWLDSATLWQDHGLQELFDGAVAAKPHRGEHGPDKPEYRVNMWRMEQWFRHAIGGAQCNLGISSHAQMMDDPWPDVGSILMPLIQGRNMPQKFSAMMNFIGYLEVKEGTDGQWRRLHTQLTGEAYGKDQYDAFPTGRLDHPTLSKVAKAIEATKVPAKPGRRAGTGRRGPQGANTRDKAKPGRRGRRAAA